MRSRLAYPEHLFVRPLLQGLDRPDSLFACAPDSTGATVLQFSARTGDLRCAFLSPIDYARHGAEFCIVPSVAASAESSCGILRLFLRSDVRHISTVAVDVRYPSEILLAKIILEERYREEDEAPLVFIPMQADVETMLAKADAALVVQTGPDAVSSDRFSLDLVAEWNDMTELPYVFGFWVGREGELTELEATGLIDARNQGLAILDHLADDIAAARGLSRESVRSYFGAISFGFGEREQHSLEEFMSYAFYHGALRDIPEVQFFDIDPPPAVRN